MATTCPVHVHVHVLVCALMYRRMGNNCEHPKMGTGIFHKHLITINMYSTLILHVYLLCASTVCLPSSRVLCESSLLFRYHTLLTLEETGLSNQEISTVDKFIGKVTQSSGGGP